jgi:hypothetical protein
MEDLLLRDDLEDFLSKDPPCFFLSGDRDAFLSTDDVFFFSDDVFLFSDDDAPRCRGGGGGGKDVLPKDGASSMGGGGEGKDLFLSRVLDREDGASSKSSGGGRGGGLGGGRETEEAEDWGEARACRWARGVEEPWALLKERRGSPLSSPGVPLGDVWEDGGEVSLKDGGLDPGADPEELGLDVAAVL